MKRIISPWGSGVSMMNGKIRLVHKTISGAGSTNAFLNQNSNDRNRLDRSPLIRGCMLKLNMPLGFSYALAIPDRLDFSGIL